MNNWICRLKVWLRDPFGRERNKEDTKKIIREFAVAEEKIKKINEDMDSFPISNMIDTRHPKNNNEKRS